MKQTLLLIQTAVFCSLIPSAALATVYTVPGTANIFSAGLATPVAPGGDGAGTLPILVSVAQNQGNIFQFQASGTIQASDQLPPVGPDGYTTYPPMNVNSYGGVSGYFGTGFALVGVFLTDATPQAPAPSTIDFTSAGLGRNFLTLTPQIGQLFFIGDGLTDGGLTQTFFIPSGATQLYLGVPDCLDAAGGAGYYGDNTGSLSVTALQVPEPTSAALLGIGASLLLAFRRRTTAHGTAA
jgi:hypothetical protein